MGNGPPTVDRTGRSDESVHVRLHPGPRALSGGLAK